MAELDKEAQAAVDLARWCVEQEHGMEPEDIAGVLHAYDQLATKAPVAVPDLACDRPPVGWTCSRPYGHDGPCPTTLAPLADRGVDLIAAERARQVWDEQHSAEHDDQHAGGELAIAACCYALPGTMRRYRLVGAHVPTLWPWNVKAWKSDPDQRVRDLVKAGALIAAEIDRIQREEARRG